MKIVRWVVLIPAAVASFYVMFDLSVSSFFFLDSLLCPPEDVISDTCNNETVSSILNAFIYFSTGLSAVVIVLISTAIAPSHKEYTAWSSFGLGTIAATYLAFQTDAWDQYLAALIGGLISVFGVVYFLRRKNNRP